MYGEELPVSQCGFLSVTEMVGALSDTLSIQPGTEEGENHWIIVESKPNDTDPNEPGTDLIKFNYFSYRISLFFFNPDCVFWLELSPGHGTASSIDAESPNASSKGFYFSCTQSAWDCEDEELSTGSQDSDSEVTVTKTIHQVNKNVL